MRRIFTEKKFVRVGVWAALVACVVPAAPAFAETSQEKLTELRARIDLSAEQARLARYRTGIVMGVGGVALIGEGLLDPAQNTTPFFAPAGISFSFVGAVFAAVGVGTLISSSPEEMLRREAAQPGPTVLSPELELAAMEELVRVQAKEVRQARILAGWFGAGLAAVSTVGFVVGPSGSHGPWMLAIGTGVTSMLAHWLVPSGVEQLVTVGPGQVGLSWHF